MSDDDKLHEYVWHNDTVSRIYRLVWKTEQEREEYLRQGHRIDAAACSIRIHALQDAIKAVGPVPSSK